MVPAGASNDDIILGPEFATARASGGGSDRMNGHAAHTISVLVEDKPGVLTRVAGCSRRAVSTSTRSRWADRVPGVCRG
jgi:hypothetical protein